MAVSPSIGTGSALMPTLFNDRFIAGVSLSDERLLHLSSWSTTITRQSRLCQSSHARSAIAPSESVLLRWCSSQWMKVASFVSQMINSMPIVMVPVFYFVVFSFTSYVASTKLTRHSTRFSICSFSRRSQNLFSSHRHRSRSKQFDEKCLLAPNAVMEKAMIYVTLKQKSKATEYLQKAMWVSNRRNCLTDVSLSLFVCLALNTKTISWNLVCTFVSMQLCKRCNVWTIIELRSWPTQREEGDISVIFDFIE